jgi:hypothetical protein
MKIAIGIILGFALGFLAHLLLPKKPATEHHWQVVRSYNAFVNDSSNFKPDPTTGLSVTTPPGDPLPSLAALVAAGELTHVDLVLPVVPYNRDVGRHWMTFAQTHKEIIYVTGNPSYTAFKPSGEQPLHLNLWFKDADQSVIQTLIRELEETSRTGSQPNGPANGSQPIRSDTNTTSSAAGSRR